MRLNINNFDRTYKRLCPVCDKVVYDSRDDVPYRILKIQYLYRCPYCKKIHATHHKLKTELV